MKRRILVHFVTVITAAVAATLVLITLLTYGMFERRVMEDLRVDARVICAMLEAGVKDTGAAGSQLRVTLIGADGTVDYDSMADSGAMGSHADRPEVRQALESGEGEDVRNSATVQRSTFYYALRLEDGSVLRVAKEASSILSVYMRAIPLILLVMAAMIGVSMAAANALTERLLSPIAAVTEDMHAAVQYPELQPLVHRLRVQHEEILQSAKMRVEFTANVSHELKTPLTAISGYAELIENGMAQGEQARRFAGEISKSANRLLALINDIIRLSQMDSSERAADMERVDLAQVAGAAVQQLRMNAAKADVSLTVEARAAVVTADRRMMEELVFNLCDNAIRYNVPGGSVRVQVHPVKEHVVLIVQDTGIGISAENQERVFERFYRVDKSRSKATGGTGLGLAIVKHIAASHGAQISLRSTPGSGTTITVTFERAK